MRELFRGIVDKIEKFNGNLNYITLRPIDEGFDIARLAVYGNISKDYLGKPVDLFKERPTDNGLYRQSISSSDMETTLEMPYFLVKAIHEKYAPKTINFAIDDV
ncbi:MAG: hypothetical protein PHH54_06355 [Candidatus Nanoarchaeia archaeon]|nr:hypothetical protein [Candidatus Nanoarchaeia archaeon]MDD5741577.1 hypothetical protein [Candidatus Nanoarchaeia archaeon]